MSTAFSSSYEHVNLHLYEHVEFEFSIYISDIR